MSQSEFAAAIRHAGSALGEPNTCNKRLVQKWESGEHGICRPNYRRGLCAVTRLPYTQLGFMDAALFESDSTSDATTVRPAATSTTQSDPSHDNGAPLDGESSDRLRFALERPEHVDVETINLIESVTASLFDLERHRPSRLLLPTVAQHVNAVAALLAGTRKEPLRQRLAATGGQASALAGWLAFDRNDARSAHRFWDGALAAAQYAADGALLACTLTYLSYSSTERGDPAAAWQLAHSAVRHVGADARSRAAIKPRSPSADKLRRGQFGLIL